MLINGFWQQGSAILSEFAVLTSWQGDFGHNARIGNKGAHMIQSPQDQFRIDNDVTGYSRESRASWIGSKLAQSTGLAPEQLDEVHNHMWLRILQGNADSAPPKNEADRLAAHIVAIAVMAEKAAATGGPTSAMAAVMQASGKGVDPLLAQRFLRLASSPIFWMALDPDGEPRAS